MTKPSSTAPTKASPKVPFVLKACNDPEREDWGFFRNLFTKQSADGAPVQYTSREMAEEATMRPLLETPADPAEARARLRLLLQMAHAKSPWRLLNMTLMGQGAGNMRGTVKAFASELRSRGTDLTTSVYERQAGQEAGFAMSDSAWKTAYEYIASNLASMTDGKPVVSRKAKYRVLGTSTNEPINAWLPEEGGVVAYVRERVKHILCAYYGENKERDRMGFRSLDLLAEHGLEADSEGLFHRKQRPDTDENNPETSADLAASRGAGDRHPDESESADEPQAGQAATVDGVAEEDAAALRAVLATAPRPLDDDAETDADALFDARAREAVRQRVDEQIHDLKQDPATRGDWPLRLFDPRYNVARGETADVATTKLMVKEMLGRLKNHDETLATDHAELVKLINEWDGTPPIVKYLPEFEAYAEQFRYALRGIDPLPVSLGSTHAPTAAELVVASQSDRAAETMQFLFGTEAPGPGPAQLHSAVAIGTMSIGDLLFTECDEDLLLEPERNDYDFLCTITKSPRLPRLSPSELHAEMRDLAKVWMATLSDSSSTTAAEFALRMKTWDPAREHISGPINRAIHDMTKQDWEDHLKDVELAASAGQVAMDF